MKAGFAKVDITPQIGVELCGFGPFLKRRSVGVRDRLWAKAAAIEQSGKTVIIVSCDLIGLSMPEIIRVRDMVTTATGIPADRILTHCTHTHSGPCTAMYNGWGERDLPYMEILPDRIASACIKAADNLREVELSTARVPCEGIGLNREYDVDAPPIEDVLNEDWRPAKPELTDTTCQVLVFRATNGDLVGFMSYFGCHPVVCCQKTRYIHGDFVGVATNMLEREHPGATGLFLQGAPGDVNSCVVHKPEKESIFALDVIASRYARAVRRGISEAKPVKVDSVKGIRHIVRFTRKNLTIDNLRDMLAKEESVIHAPGADEDSDDFRLATVCAVALRTRIAKMQAGEEVSPPVELQGIKIGPISLLGSPLEIFQAVKNEVVAAAKSPIPLVLGLANGDIGYAPDHTAAAKGGYTADMVPLIVGEFPFTDIHTELVRELLALEADL